MLNKTLVAVAALLSLSTSHADDFVCPDSQSEKLEKEGFKISLGDYDKESITRAVPEYEAVIAKADRPEDRFVRQTLCNRIAYILVDADMANEDIADLTACPENTVANLVAREERRKQIWGEDPVLPIVRVAPVWPPAALNQQLSGEVIVEFTVSKKGRPKKLVVVESTDPLFERHALAAVKKFMYKPHKVDGKPVNKPGVRDRIVFDYEKWVTDGQLQECRRSR
jgi:TonB family protein